MAGVGSVLWDLVCASLHSRRKLTTPEAAFVALAQMPLEAATFSLNETCFMIQKHLLFLLCDTAVFVQTKALECDHAAVLKAGQSCAPIAHRVVRS